MALFKGMICLIVVLFIMPDSSRGQISEEDIISDFECGNISNIRITGLDSLSFDTRRDAPSENYYGWYYFAITGNNGRTATLKITNPQISWHNASSCPRYSDNNVDWHLVDDFSMQGDSLIINQYLDGDTVWFAMGPPFTVSRMYTFLDTLADHNFVNLETIGYSVNARPIKKISIDNDNNINNEKKSIWIISRQHPMESSASYLLHSLMNRIVANDPLGYRCRRDLEFNIIPIINVDGVAEGYSRHNVNDLDLNRNWQSNLAFEQPEVQAAHTAIENYLNGGDSIDFFADFHAAPQTYDFGYRLHDSHVSSQLYSEQDRFLRLLTDYDSYQDYLRWDYLGNAAPTGGVSAWMMNYLYGINSLLFENPWCRRFDNECITVSSLAEQGANTLKTIYDYLYPLQAYDAQSAVIDSVISGDVLYPKLNDYLSRSLDSLSIMLRTFPADDSELVTLYKADENGQFVTVAPVNTNSQAAIIGDRVISLQNADKVVLEFIDPTLSERSFKISLLAVGTPVGIDDDVNNILNQGDFLSGNYPNPFNPATNISFGLAKRSHVKITVYNILGQLTATLIDEKRPAGVHSVSWNGRDSKNNELSTGIYFYQIKAGNFIDTKKMILLR